MCYHYPDIQSPDGMFPETGLHLWYQLRIPEGEVGLEVASCVRAFSQQKKCVVIELNVQKDHVHIVVMIPPKLSVSDYMGIVATSIRRDSYKKSGFSQIYDDVLCLHSGLVTIIVKKPEETRFLSRVKLVAGIVKGRTALRVFNKFRKLKK